LRLFIFPVVLIWPIALIIVESQIEFKLG